jgi:hypothetical protein
VVRPQAFARLELLHAGADQLAPDVASHLCVPVAPTRTILGPVPIVAVELNTFGTVGAYVCRAGAAVSSSSGVGQRGLAAGAPLHLDYETVAHGQDHGADAVVERPRVGVMARRAKGHDHAVPEERDVL